MRASVSISIPANPNDPNKMLAVIRTQKSAGRGRRGRVGGRPAGTAQGLRLRKPGSSGDQWRQY